MEESQTNMEDATSTEDSNAIFQRLISHVTADPTEIKDMNTHYTIEENDKNIRSDQFISLDDLCTKYKRPPIMIDSSEMGFFQMLTLDYIYRTSNAQQNAPVIRLYCLTPNGASIVLLLDEFFPYFYVRYPPDIEINQKNLRLIQDELASKMTPVKPNQRLYKTVNSPIKNIELCKRTCFFGYHHEETYMKIFLYRPSDVPKLRTILEDNNWRFLGSKYIYKADERGDICEANIAYETRFLVDSGLQPGGWFQIPTKYLKKYLGDYAGTLQTQAAYQIHWQNIQYVDPSNPIINTNADARIIALDIEVVREKGFPFPPLASDILSHVSLVFGTLGQKPALTVSFIYYDPSMETKRQKLASEKKDVKIEKEETTTLPQTQKPSYTFQIKDHLPPHGSGEYRHYPFSTEAVRFVYTNMKTMMLDLSLFIRKLDPDFFLGHNIANFDFPYLLKLSQLLDIQDHFGKWGKMVDSMTGTFEKKEGFSRQMGGTQHTEFRFHGINLLDLYPISKKTYKDLSSYSLASICRKVLGVSKIDVNHTQVRQFYWTGTLSQLNLIEIYNAYDSGLCFEWINKTKTAQIGLEMTRMFSCKLEEIYSKGQQARILPCILKKTAKAKYVIPYRKREQSSHTKRHVDDDDDNDSDLDIDEDRTDEQPPTQKRKKKTDTYEGAIVIKPKIGFYGSDGPYIATLDFASLYPSIIMAFNLSHDTHIASNIIAPTDIPIEEMVSGVKFIRAEHRQGIIPNLLKELVAERQRFKNLMKSCKDEKLNELYDIRQQLLKLVSNSIYGLTGFAMSLLANQDIAKTVTAIGRELIKMSQLYLEKKGHPVYQGDTDSVFWNTFSMDMDAAFKLGKLLATEITKLINRDPIKLEFEKLCRPLLIVTKKRYAADIYTENERKPKRLTKGIDLVRRDTIPLVKTLMTSVLDMIMTNQIQESITYTKTMIKKMLCAELDLSYFVISKSLNKPPGQYKSKQGHIVVAQKKIKRGEEPPGIGDRIPFVYLNGGKKDKVTELAEDPLRVLQDDLPIHYDHYLHLVTKALGRLVAPFYENKEKAIQDLSHGDHTRTRIIQTGSKKTGITKYFDKIPVCLYCRTPLTTTDKLLCSTCQSDYHEVYMKYLKLQRENEELFAKCWSQCQICSKTLFNPIECSNTVCPIFYTREMAKKNAAKYASIVDSLDW